MRNKPILIAIVMVSSSLAGCTSDNSEEDLSARYQEGYDAGYAAVSYTHLTLPTNREV